MLCEVTLWPCLTFTAQNLPASRYLFSFCSRRMPCEKARLAAVLALSPAAPLFLTTQQPRPLSSWTPHRTFLCEAQLVGPDKARDKFLQVWAGVGRCGQVWAGVGRCGQVWAILCESR